MVVILPDCRIPGVALDKNWLVNLALELLIELIGREDKAAEI